MQRKANLVKMVLLTGIGIAALCSGFAIAPPRSASSQAQVAAPTKSEPAAPQSFEVASIKLSQSQTGGMSSNDAGGRFAARGMTTKMLIQQAYDIQDYQLSGAPAWVSSERYDIQAKAESPNVSREQMRIMLQSLLAERFNLKIHRETKILPIYALLVTKNGPKLKPSELPNRSTSDAAPPKSAAGDPVVRSGGAATGGGAGGGARVSGAGGATAGSGASGGTAMMSGSGATVSSLASGLSRSLGRPVIDQTNLEGRFDYKLEYSPGVGSAGGDPGLQASGDSGPSIFAALQEQLGLRLESQKGPVEIIVIDSIEKPSGN